VITQTDLQAFWLQEMHRGSATGGDDDLQESLLGDSQPSSAPAQQQQALIHYKPFNVDVFIEWVLKSWAAFLSELQES
jgi:hypothetical protein